MSNIGSVGNSNFQEISKAKPHSTKPKQETQSEPKDNVSIGGKQDAAPAEKKKWTVLLYSAADNNLQDALVSDVAELEAVGSDKNTHVVAQLDRGKHPSSLSGSWAGCRRFELVNANHDPKKPTTITSPVLEDLGQVNMSDSKVLTDFVTWGMKNYPADNYILVMSDHGGGWHGVAEDESHNGWMSMPTMRKALEDAEKETGKKIDVLGFDACLMASAEVADELKNVVNYMVASENTIGGDGWPYTKIFTSKVMENLQKTLDSKLSIAPRDVAMKIIKDSDGYASTDTLSAFDMSKVAALTKSTDEFAKAILDSSLTKAELKQIAQKSHDFYGFTDQYDFAQNIMNNPKADDKLKATAQKVMDTIKDVIIAEQHTDDQEGSHGVTVGTFNDDLGGAPSKPSYQELQFAQNTQWDEAMNKNSRKRKA